MQYHDEIYKYVVRADNLIKNLFFSLSPLYKKEFGSGQDIMIPLFTTLHSTSESILVLLLNQAIFDADVLLRTVMEGTIKYCYLMTGDAQEKIHKYEEYHNQITDIDRLIDHQKAIETIGILREFSTNSTVPFELSILSDEEVQKLKQEYPSKIRKELKQKWNYQNLLRNLAEAHEEYKAQLGTSSTYSLTSHLIHYDWTGVSMRQAQISDAATKSAVVFDIAHAVRIISNVLSFYIFRVTEYLRGNQYSSIKATELSIETIDFISELIEIGDSIIEHNIISDPMFDKALLLAVLEE